MGDRETPRMRKYGASKTTRIMMATVPHVTSGSGLRKFQADGFLLDWVYMSRDYKTPIFNNSDSTMNNFAWCLINNYSWLQKQNMLSKMWNQNQQIR